MMSVVVSIKLCDFMYTMYIEFITRLWCSIIRCSPNTLSLPDAKRNRITIELSIFFEKLQASTQKLWHCLLVNCSGKLPPLIKNLVLNSLISIILSMRRVSFVIFHIPNKNRWEFLQWRYSMQKCCVFLQLIVVLIINKQAINPLTILPQFYMDFCQTDGALYHDG